MTNQFLGPKNEVADRYFWLSNILAKSLKERLKVMMERMKKQLQPTFDLLLEQPCKHRCLLHPAQIQHRLDQQLIGCQIHQRSEPQLTKSILLVSQPVQ